MQLGKKSDSSMNDSTNSSPVNPSLDAPSIQENGKDLLSSNDESVQLQAEVVTDTSKKKQQGFPVLGCLTIFLGLTIFGVLTLPSLMSCSNKARQAEAKTYVGAMNRSQQAYFLENNAFSNSFDYLGLGVATQTENYQYSIRATKTAVFNYGVVRHDYAYEKVQFGPFYWTKRTNSRLKSYVGGVFLLPANQVDPKAEKKEMTTVVIICESVSPGTVKPADPILKNGVPTCGIGTKDLRRP